MEKDQIVELEMELVDGPDERVRLEIDEDEIAELAQSISEIGLLQPIQVRPKGGRYEVVFGERRYLAHKRLGKETIRAVISDMQDDEVRIARGTENLARKNLSPIEEAAVYKDLIENCGLNTFQLSRKVGISEGLIKRRIRLLGLDPKLQKALHSGAISVGIAEELRRCRRKGDMEYLLALAIDHGVTVAVMREWVNDYNARGDSSEGDIVEGGGGGYVPEKRSYYVPCDLCDGPVEINEVVTCKLCSACFHAIKSGMEGSKS